MRTRALTTTKILALAAIATAPACSKEPKSDPVTKAVVTETQGADPNLVGLREELVTTDRKQVDATLKHFRPLCDKDGYPLVGNLNRKSPNYDVTELCTEIRTKKLVL